ncbi:putative Ig domain-containing protein [Actinokineospora diospyrosa]|uniref:Ig domain-containing protein n=2 Tax=Actinokineospora diospyrosa TaxID=103728 RepID=A0ABT1ICC1_9PSEU|nr:putative Ig domain-containing protein [Actinokineospora diospyrosa]
MIIQMTAKGGTAPYTWSATGLPTDVTINATTGLISGTPTQTLINATVTVSAKDTTGRSTQSRFEITVVPPDWTCPSGGQKLVNPGFESGGTGWWENTDNINRHTGALARRTGTWAAALRADSAGGAIISQRAQVPRECAWSTLTFWAKFVPLQGVTDDNDAMRLLLNDEPVFFLKGNTMGTGYRQYTVDLSRYAGQTVILWFTGWGDYKNISSIVLDDFALNAR